jgi:hypothetical protein
MSTVTTRGSATRTGTTGPTSPSPRAGNRGGDPPQPGPPGPPGPGGPPGGAGGPHVAGPPQQGIFALTPARAVQGLIDYTSRHGQRLYEMATQSLETKFDCKPDKLRLFVDTFRKRANSANWSSTLQVSLNGTNYDLTDNYGFLTFDQIRTHVMTYVNTQTRDYQNSYQIYECLFATLTDDARTKVATRHNEYTVLDQPDGLLFFKAIIATAQVDTPATISQIRYKLMNLSQHMQDVDSDIEQFNIDVQTYVMALEARGNTTSDLLVNLFRGYKSASDETFRKYICDREDDYNDGTLLNLSPEKLMSLAVNKYRTLVDDNTWNQQSAQQKQIVALNAQLQRFIGDKNKKPTTTNSSNKEFKPKPVGKGKDKKGFKDRKYPDWKYKAPSANEPKSKSIKGKKFYWCKHHELWCEHTEDQCRKAKGNTDGTNKASDGNKDAPKIQLQLNRNLAAISTDDDF